MIKRIFSLALLLALLMTGCKVESKTWIDQMLSEMEREMAIAYSKKAEGRENAATLVAQKYFTPGMSRAEVTPLLNDLKSQGFRVFEDRHEGHRKWLDGEFKPYMDERHRKNQQKRILPGVSSILIVKEYGRARVIITKHLAVSFIIKDVDDRVADVKAVLTLSAL